MTTVQTRPPAEITAPPGVLDWMWSNRWIGIAIAVAVIATFAQLAAEFTPRGPVTTTQALITMATALAVGIGVGIALPTRWMLLGGPVLFTVIFELSRIGYVGASVDAPSFGSILEVIAFMVGRVFPAILTLIPLATGTVIGIATAVRLGHPTATPIGAALGTTTLLTVIALGALGFFLTRPATTSPILGSDDGIAELITVDINGHTQGLMIRGRHIDSPVMLYLAGGPGGTDLGAMRRDVGLEQHFVVVTWDQRGTGRSYPALDPTDTLTVESLVSDTIAVTEYLRERFNQDRVYLVGQSWGSGLGVLAAKERPDLYHAFVGVGQMVSFRDTDIMFWEDTLAWADERGDVRLADTLRRNGPPPYTDIRKYGPITSTEHDWNPYPGFNPDTEMPAILFVPEYSLIDRVNAFRGFFDVATVIYPQIQDIDFRVDATSLEIPYYMVLGEYEARGRAVPANEWFGMLQAPTKEMVVFENSGHRPNFDRPSEFVEVMLRVSGR